MALPARELPQVPSLLDRLLDDAPAQASEPHWAASYHIGRMKQSLGRTWRRRPDLLANVPLSAEQVALLEEYKSESKENFAQRFQKR